MADKIDEILSAVGQIQDNISTFKDEIKELVTLRLDNFKKEIIELIDKHMSILNEKVEVVDDRVDELNNKMAELEQTVVFHDALIEQHKKDLDSVIDEVKAVKNKPLSKFWSRVGMITLAILLLNTGTLIALIIFLQSIIGK